MLTRKEESNKEDNNKHRSVIKDINQVKIKEKKRKAELEAEEGEENWNLYQTPNKKRKTLCTKSKEKVQVGVLAFQEDQVPHHHPTVHQDDGGDEPLRENWSRPHHHPVKILGSDEAYSGPNIMVDQHLGVENGRDIDGVSKCEGINITNMECVWKKGMIVQDSNAAGANNGKGVDGVSIYEGINITNSNDDKKINGTKTNGNKMDNGMKKIDGNAKNVDGVGTYEGINITNINEDMETNGTNGNMKKNGNSMDDGPRDDGRWNNGNNMDNGLKKTEPNGMVVSNGEDKITKSDAEGNSEGSDSVNEGNGKMNIYINATRPTVKCKDNMNVGDPNKEEGNIEGDASASMVQTEAEEVVYGMDSNDDGYDVTKTMKTDDNKSNRDTTGHSKTSQTKNIKSLIGMFNIGGQNLIENVKTKPQTKPKPQLKLRPPSVNDSPKLGTKPNRTGTKPKTKNQQLITNQEKITKYVLQAKGLENEDYEEKKEVMKKTNEGSCMDTVKTNTQKFTKVLIKNSDKKVKPPLTDINNDSFNLKNFLALKKMERDRKLGQNQESIVIPIANRIDKMRPSPNTNISMGTKDEVLRQVTTVLRSNAAEQQPEIKGNNKYEPEDAIGPL